MSSGNVTTAQHEATSAVLASFLNTDVNGLVRHDGLGLVIAFYIAGFCSMQAIDYYSNTRKEPLWVRCFIACMLLLLAGQLAGQFWGMWHLVLNYDTFYLAFLETTRLSWIQMILFGIVMGPAAMGFIGLRTWKLYKKPLVPGIIGLILLLGMVVSGIVAVHWAFGLPTNPYGTVQQVYMSLDRTWGKSLSRRLIALMTFDLTINLSLTIANLIKFRSFIDEDGSSNSVVRQLFAMILQSMVPSALGTVALAYFFISNREVGTWVRTLTHIQPSLYVLACLTAVNAKQGIEKALLSNNLEINVISADDENNGNPLMTELSGDPEFTRVGPQLTYQSHSPSYSRSHSRRQSQEDKEKGGPDSEFMDFLAAGPEEPVKTGSRLEKFGISFGKSKVELEDEEKGQ